MNEMENLSAAPPMRAPNPANAPVGVPVPSRGAGIRESSIVFQPPPMRDGAPPKVTIAPPTAPKRKTWEEYGGTAPSPEFNRWVAASVNKPLATAEELEALRKIDAVTSRLRERHRQFWNDRAEERIRELRGELTDAAISGTGQELVNIPDYAEIYTQYIAARAAISDEMKNQYALAVPILGKIAERLAEACDERADKVQGDELALHGRHDAKFGWDYVPSRTVIQLRQAEWRVPALIPGPSMHFSPKIICESMGVTL